MNNQHRWALVGARASGLVMCVRCRVRARRKGAGRAMATLHTNPELRGALVTTTRGLVVGYGILPCPGKPPKQPPRLRRRRG